jgi:hypothetical protein
LRHLKCKGSRPGFQLIPDGLSKENRDLKKESSVQREIREMKEKHKKENPDTEEYLIEELDSKEFKEEIEQGLVQPKYTIYESCDFNITDTF